MVQRHCLEILQALYEIGCSGFRGQVEQVNGGSAHEPVHNRQVDPSQTIHRSHGVHDRRDLVRAERAHIPRVQIGAGQIELDVRPEKTDEALAHVAESASRL